MPRSSSQIHARCGKPWSAHRFVTYMDVDWPRCDDEDELPAPPEEAPDRQRESHPRGAGLE